MISAEANYGRFAKPGQRKVMLWSGSPWLGADDLGSADLPSGRYIAAATDTPVGSLQVIGVCIPWGFSNVSLGSRDKKPWEDHSAYLHGLAALLPPVIARGSTIIMGDFNQTIPRTRAPRALSELLMESLPETLLLPTSGTIPEIERPSIDHVAHTDDLETLSVEAISNIWDGGKRLSDHFGLALELRRRIAR